MVSQKKLSKRVYIETTFFYTFKAFIDNTKTNGMWNIGSTILLAVFVSIILVVLSMILFVLSALLAVLAPVTFAPEVLPTLQHRPSHLLLHLDAVGPVLYMGKVFTLPAVP